MTKRKKVLIVVAIAAGVGYLYYRKVKWERSVGILG